MMKGGQLENEKPSLSHNIKGTNQKLKHLMMHPSKTTVAIPQRRMATYLYP